MNDRNFDQRTASVADFFEAVPDALLIVDDAGIIRDTNAQAAVIFGFEPGELAGRGIDTLVPDRFRTPHGRHRADYTTAPRVRPMGTGILLVARRKDGSEFPVDIRLGPLAHDGGRLTLCIARDVTERRAAETEIRTRAAQQAAVVELGREALGGGPLPALMQLAGELLAGTLGVEYVETLELAPDQQALWLVAGVGWRAGLVGRESAANDPGTYPGYVLMTNGVVVLDEVASETRFRVPARLTEHGVVSGVSTVIGSLERPYGVLGAWTTRRRAFTRNDLHFVQAIAHLLGEAVERWLADDEVRRINAVLETRVRERTAELESANRELEAFCRSVSHDLRAPLRGIDGFSLAVIEEYGERLDATGREYLQRVRAGIQRMGQIIDDLLALSRVLRVEMDRGPVDLSALATRVLDELRETDPKRRVDAVIAPGVVATGDERLLRLAIENLLGNAWKFTARRSDARIEFGVSEGDDAPAYFVRDNGAGFDMAYVDQLFGVFQRLHRQSEFPGNGVGLATVRRIIERHGGRVWAEGVVEQGATFSFTL